MNERKAEAADFPWESDGYHAQVEFFDGAVFDGHRPNEYLAQFTIGLKAGECIENGGPVTSRPKVHDLENVGEKEMTFMTIEFLDSANKPLVLPAHARPAA